MRKFLIIVTTVLSLSSVLSMPRSGAQAPGFALAAPVLSGATGSEVRVPLTAMSASGLGALHVELTYDPAVLEPKTVEKGKLAVGNTIVDSNATPGRYVIGLVAAEGIEGSGEIVVVKFTVLGAKGAVSDLGLDSLRAWENDTNRLELRVEPTAGRFTVASKKTLQRLYLLIAAAAVLLLLLFLVGRSRRRQRPVAAAS